MQIHELNNYSGSLGANSFFAVDDGTDTGKISAEQLLAETNSDISQLETSLNGRIDNIIAGGTAPSAAEVTDARRGANGVNYASLGAAIRTQISDEDSKIAKLTGVVDNVAYYPTFTQGGYYEGTGNFASNSSWGYTPMFEVEPNTTYYLNVPTDQYYTLYDSDQNVIPVYSGSKKFTTPSNAAFARLGVFNTRQAACVVTKDGPYESYLEDLQEIVNDQIVDKKVLTERTLIKDFILQGSELQYCNTINIDRSYKNKFVISNPDTNTSTINFNIALTYAGSRVGAASYESSVAPGESVTWDVDPELAQYGSWEGMFASSFIGFCGYLSVNEPLYVTVISEANQYIDNMRSALRTVVCDPNSTGGGVFNNIQKAIDYCKTHFDVQNESATVFLKDGTYTLNYVSARNAVINKGANRINIVGESRDGVKIVLTNTPAENNKIIEHGGPSVLKNISFYSYWDDDGSTISYVNNSYCIHNDLTFTSDEQYETAVENCYLYSESFAPVGAGLQNKQTQRYIDVESVFNSADTNPQGYNQWAPIYIHGPSNPNAADCAVVIDGCTCIAKKGTMAIVLPNVEGSLQYTDIPVSIRRTIGVTNGSTITNVSKATHDLQTDSALNNVEAWNY